MEATRPGSALPAHEVDGATQTELTAPQLRQFHQQGFLIVRHAIGPEELARLQHETAQLIEDMKQQQQHPDYWWNDQMPSGWYKTAVVGSDNRTDTAADSKPLPIERGIPFRIEYPLEKSQTCRQLLGLPLVLTAMSQLIDPAFIPTWDSLVFKAPGKGVPIKWHRDASAASVDTVPAIDVGYYLDAATAALGNCVWAIPGSHQWPDSLAASMIEHLTANGFGTSGAVPLELAPGDLLLHNILVLHGSPACVTPALRRTVYFEFRSIAQELAMGPHTPAYVPLKQRVLQGCLQERMALGEVDSPFVYQPQLEARAANERGAHEVAYRVVHEDYFRADYRG